MSKAVVIGAVVIIGVGAVGGGGYYYVSQQAENKFQEKIALFKEKFPGSTLTYEKHHLSIFSKAATMDKVVLTDKNGYVYTADKIDAVLGSGDAITKLSVDKLTVKDKQDTGSFNIGHIDLEDFNADMGAIVVENGRIQQFFPSKMSFGLLNIQNIEFNDRRSNGFKIAQYQMKNYGLGKKTDIVWNGLSLFDRRTNSDISSIKIDQINLADIAQKQEVFYADVKASKPVDILTRTLIQNISEIQFNLFSIDGLQFNRKYTGGLKLAHYELKDYRIGHNTSQSLKDFSISGFESEKISFKIGSVENTGYDLASLVKMMESLRLSDVSNISKLSLQIQQDYVKKVGNLKSYMKISGVELAVDGNRLSLGSLIANSVIVPDKTEQSYTLDNLEFTLPDYMRNEYIDALKELGYNKITVTSGTLKAQYQPNTKALSLSLDKLTFKDIGSISATLKGNLPIEAIYMDPQRALMSPEVKFKEFTMSVDNTGLMEKILQKTSQKKGISEEEVKKEMLASAGEGNKDFEKMSPAFTKEAMQTLEIFLQNPQKTQINITSIPEKPLSLADFDKKNEQEVFNLFNWHMKATPIK